MSYLELQTHEVTTRKIHKCEWCGETINVGERAQYRAYIFDGNFTSVWQHPECYTAMSESDWLLLAEGWERGEFERGSMI